MDQILDLDVDLVLVLVARWIDQVQVEVQDLVQI